MPGRRPVGRQGIAAPTEGVSPTFAGLAGCRPGDPPPPSVALDIRSPRARRLGRGTGRACPSALIEGLALEADMNDMSAISNLVDRELHVIVRSRKVRGDDMRKVAFLFGVLVWIGSIFVTVAYENAIPAILGSIFMLTMGARFGRKMTPAEQKEWASRPAESYLNSAAWDTNPGNLANPHRDLHR